MRCAMEEQSAGTRRNWFPIGLPIRQKRHISLNGTRRALSREPDGWRYGPLGSLMQLPKGPAQGE